MYQQIISQASFYFYKVNNETPEKRKASPWRFHYLF